MCSCSYGQKREGVGGDKSKRRDEKRREVNLSNKGKGMGGGRLVFLEKEKEEQMKKDGGWYILEWQMSRWSVKMAHKRWRDNHYIVKTCI